MATSIRHVQAALMREALALTAYHEAGHAVAFHRLFPRGRIGGSLSVEPDQQKGTAGRHSAEEMIFSLDEDEGVIEDHCRREAAYACAGYAACRYRSRSIGPAAVCGPMTAASTGRCGRR